MHTLLALQTEAFDETGSRDTLLPPSVTWSVLRGSWDACVDAGDRGVTDAIDGLTCAQEVGAALLRGGMCVGGGGGGGGGGGRVGAIPPSTCLSEAMARARVAALTTICEAPAVSASASPQSARRPAASGSLCPSACPHRTDGGEAPPWSLRLLVLCLTHAVVVAEPGCGASAAGGGAPASWDGAVAAAVAAMCRQQKCQACASLRPTSLLVPFTSAEWLRLSRLVGELLCRCPLRVVSVEAAPVASSADDDLVLRNQPKWKAVAVSRA
jgi:hypothetical protein